jgi:hypothetical protein
LCRRFAHIHDGLVPKGFNAGAVAGDLKDADASAPPADLEALREAERAAARAEVDATPVRVHAR